MTQFTFDLVGGEDVAADTDITYLCVKCKQVLHESKYRFRPERANYRVKECKDCEKVTAKETASIRKTAPPQTDACECCGKKTTEMRMDHCHETVVFRGWLCQSCNWGIGNLGDNLEGVTKAVRYLKGVTNE